MCDAHAPAKWIDLQKDIRDAIDQQKRTTSASLRASKLGIFAVAWWTKDAHNSASKCENAPQLGRRARQESRQTLSPPFLYRLLRCFLSTWHVAPSVIVFDWVGSMRDSGREIGVTHKAILERIRSSAKFMSRFHISHFTWQRQNLTSSTNNSFGRCARYYSMKDGGSFQMPCFNPG